MPVRTSFLIVDGTDAEESGEGLLVEHLARQAFDHVVRLPYFPKSSRKWTVVWYVGHTTVYRTAKIASLEKREGSAYWRLVTAKALKQLDTQLLVLATCFSGSRFYPIPNEFAARYVITYPHKLSIDDSLVFAARFMRPLNRCIYRGGFRVPDLRTIFQAAQKSSSKQWKLAINTNL